ncbi:MAG: hypothetical protein WBF42_05475, partial [Terracidiphilus sp.]
QLGERLVRNEEASGSIPLSSTIESLTCWFYLFDLQRRRTILISKPTFVHFRRVTLRRPQRRCARRRGQ